MACIVNLKGLNEDQLYNIEQGLCSSCSYCEHSNYRGVKVGIEFDLQFKACAILTIETPDPYCSSFSYDELCDEPL
jgi:hypothetical protein